MFLLALLPLAAGTAPGAETSTANARYPGLGLGFLGSARLEPLDGNTLLTAEGFRITTTELNNVVHSMEPKLRGQYEKNLLFLLEQMATRKALLGEAKKDGISGNSKDESQIIADLFGSKSAGVIVSDDEARAFYLANREMTGGAPFEQVKDGIRQYLLQEKKQQIVGSYISSLRDSIRLRVNETWLERQSRQALDNPVDKARASRKPTMVEFGATGCIPCDMMQPILDKLRKNYPDRLNVVFVHVGKEQVLAARYGIRSIPVQVFFDGTGKEVFRHVGFFPETGVTGQLTQMGVAK